jgi:hypothetical protein
MIKAQLGGGTVNQVTPGSAGGELSLLSLAVTAHLTLNE